MISPHLANMLKQVRCLALFVKVYRVHALPKKKKLNHHKKEVKFTSAENILLLKYGRELPSIKCISCTN